MKTDKLFTLLKDLTPAEFEKFGVFLRSPYFNKLNDIIRFYSVIKKHYPEFPVKKCDPEKLFTIVYPREKFDYGRYRVLASRTLSLAKRFLAVSTFENNAIQTGFTLAERLELNNKLFGETINEIEKKLESSRIKDEHYFHNMHKLRYLKNISSGHFSGGIDHKHEVDTLMLYALARGMKIYSVWINNHNTLNTRVDTGLLEKLEKIVSIEPFSSSPVIKISYNTLLFTLNFSDEHYFFEHLRLTEMYPNSISDDDLYDSYILLLNFCAIKNMGGDKTFNTHKFELYKKMLAKRLFFIHSDKLPYEMYNNITGAALETGNTEWAEGFIERYKNTLEEQYREDIYIFSKAKICFTKKEYEKVLEYMAGLMNIENPFYKFAVKEIIIKTYYELGYYENILSIIDSYKHMLSKTRMLNKNIRESRKAFLNALNNFIKFKINDDKDKLSELKAHLEGIAAFTQKDWLMEKLRQSVKIDSLSLK